MGQGRGLTSLTPEPGFFGIYLIASSMLIILLNNFSVKKDARIHLINIISIIFLALSIMNFLYLLTFLFSFCVFKVLSLKIYKSYIFLLPILILLFTGIIYFDDFLSNYRIYDLGKVILLNPYKFLVGSIGDNSSFWRIADIIYPLQISINNFFFPQGFSGLLFKEGNVNFQSIFENYNSTIMSWLSSWIFSLGIFGIISLSTIFKSILKNYKSFKEYFFIYCFLIFTLTSIPLSFPLIPIIISVLLKGNSLGMNENNKLKLTVDK